jgi:hypothetical protein
VIIRAILLELRNAEDQTVRLVAFIEAFEQSALIGPDKYDRAVLARRQTPTNQPRTTPIFMQCAISLSPSLQNEGNAKARNMLRKNSTQIPQHGLHVCN